MLGYCRELGVELEVLVNTSRNALVRPDLSAPPMQIRQAVNDSRGHIAELLAKAVNRQALDQELNAADRQNLLGFLKTWGDLSEKLDYLGSARSGYKVWPGAGDQLAQKNEPLPLRTLLNPALGTALMIDEYPEFSPTMFQPVGGMDHPGGLPAPPAVVPASGAEVRSIRNHEDRVEIGYRDRRAAEQQVTSDYAVIALPLPLLARIDSNFTAPVRQAISAVQFGYANKVAWQSRRFWETDYQIYGGLSFINQEASGLWYPSGGFNQAEGILIAAYNNGEVALRRQGHRRADRPVAPGRGAAATTAGPAQAAGHRLEPHSPQPRPLDQPRGGGAGLRPAQPGPGPRALTSDGLAHSGVGIWQEAAAGAARRVVRNIFERAQGTSQHRQTA